MTAQLPDIADLIDGEWGTPTVDLGVALEDPATGKPISRAVATATERVERAIAVADAATSCAPTSAPPCTSWNMPAGTCSAIASASAIEL